MAPEEKRVLVPSVLLGDSQRLFEEAGTELVFALPEPLRGPGGSPEREAERDRLSEAGVRVGLRSAHALCAIGPRGQLRVTAELLDAAPSLQVVFVPSSGTDAIDLAAATERGVAVVNATGNNYWSVAEHTLGLMLSRAVPTKRTGNSPAVMSPWQATARPRRLPPRRRRHRRRPA